MLSNFEALLWKFKYFITELINVAGNNFTENFNAYVPVEIFWNV